MSSISGISSSSISSMLQNMQSKSADKFKELDTDSNGGLDKTELSTMAKELSKMTGKTLNVDEAMTTYDANSDGKLSQDETDTMMQKTLGSPSSTGARAMKAYQANSGDDQFSELLKMLEESQSSSSTSSASTENSRPNPEEMFKKIDSDGSGGLNQTELDAWSKDVQSVTGQTIDTKNAISTYDNDGDGALNKNEMGAMMKTEHGKSGANNGGAPSGGAQGPDGVQGKTKSDDSTVYDEKDTNKDGTVSALEELAYNLNHIQNTSNDLNISVNE